jgi:integrase
VEENNRNDGKRKGNPPNLYKVGNSWMIDFVYHGQRYRENIGPVSRTVAQETRDRRKAAAAEGRLEVATKVKDLTFEKACDKYLEWYKANREPNSYSRHFCSAKHLRPFFGNRRLSSISAFMIEKYKLGRKATDAAPATINRELSMLGNLFTKAIQWKFAKSNPTTDVPHFKEDNARNTYLTEEEARRVLTCCSPPLSLLVLAAMHTGFRTKELRSLTWSHVDFRNNSLTVLSAYAKNDETRTVPMTPDLESALRKVYDEREPGNGDRVFLNRDGKPWKSWRTAFKNALKAADIENFRFHDLRHCFGSYLGMNNTNLKAMMELLGQKRPEMTTRYTHLSVEYKREAVAKLPASRNLEAESPQISPSTKEPKVVNFGK